MIFGAGMAAGALIFFLLQPYASAPAIQPVFSPDGGHAIIEYLDSAEKSIDIEMYVFSSRDVVEALERAKSRGVKVRIILERDVISGENNEIRRELLSKGFDVRFAGSAYKLTHSKFIIVDGKAVLVGSHNLSNSALYKNREASVIIREAAIIRDFQGAFGTDWAIAY